MNGSPVLDTTTASVPRQLAWFKFYSGDWQGNELLPMCSLAARRLLAEFLWLMHKAVPYGHLLVNGRQPTDAELARLVRAKSLGGRGETLPRREWADAWVQDQVTPIIVMPMRRRA